MLPEHRAEEEAYLQRVLEIAQSTVDETNAEIERQKKELRILATNVNDELTNAITVFNDGDDGGDGGEAGVMSFDKLIDIATAEREAFKANVTLAEANKALFRAQSQLDNPYFGRVDFRDTGAAKPYYIGKFNLVDRANLRMYIVDWRSPVASIFYDFDTGAAFYVTPNGRRDGFIDLKRQYKIQRGAFVYLFDSDVTVTDEVLARALSESSGDRLKVIVGSIQRGQNAAIRHNAYGALTVTGPAGSGKTSVGMHRLAWLLYQNRENLKAGEIVTITSSEVFASYIANILPELGEEDVQSPVFGDLMKPFLSEGYAFEDAYEQVRYVSGAEPDDERVADIEIIYSAEFMRFINDYYAGFTPEYQDVVYNGDVVVPASQQRNTAAASDTLDVAVNRVTAQIKSLCEQYFDKKSGAIKSGIEVSSEELLFDNEIDLRFYRETRDFTRNAVRDFLARNGLGDAVAAYASMLERFLNGEHAETLRRLNRRITKKTLLYEDASVILRILALTGGVKRQPNIKHVLLDEAQDYGLPQLLFLKHVYSRAGFTVLLDPNQAIYPAITTPDTDAITALFGGEIRRLTNSYRCTRQIFDFARVFVGLPEISGYYREGEDVAFLSGDELAYISDLLSRDDVSSGTVGIITATRLHAVELYRALKEKFPVRVIENPDDELKTGITVLPAAFVKGLEFDTAIIADGFAHWDERFRGRLAYTLATRAQHRLFIIGNETLFR